MDPYKIISHPVMTEVTSRLLETENKLVFVVHRSAKKKDIKAAVEMLYDVVVEKINSTITTEGEKKAFVKLHPDYKAVDIAIKLGIL